MADKDKLRFLTGQEANLKDKTLVRGQVYFAISSDTDSGKIYFDAPIDKNTTKRILMSSDHAKTADKATSADRAIADSNGRKFTETYVSEIKLDNAGTTILYKYPDITTWKELKPKFLPLTGGTITGELYADSITASDLLVNGSARFVNTILGNIETANQWKTARGFQIADADAAHTSVSVNVNGSGNVVLKLPSTIKAALQGNADTATKATNDSNNKKITDEYLHRVSNTSSTLNQFSGAPKYLLGIESFTDGGEVKWQSVDSVKVGSASEADKWNTARNFQVSDSDAAHTGTAVSVNGSKAIVLPLPETIKATLEGNASSANKVNHKYTLTLGTTKQTAFDGSADVSITITPKSIGALGKDENAVSSAKWSTARTFYVADADASNTGAGVSVDGSKDITLKLPSTIKGNLKGNADTATTATNADKLDGYHRAGLYSSPGEWINANGYTKSITVNGNADTYYPVLISITTEKSALNYISVWKNLGTKTATYPGNHSNGTSSMWLIYEGRNWYWDGNGGYLKCWYYSMPYATLCAKAEQAGNGVGDLVIYLRGGGTEYNISTTYNSTVTVYYEMTNLGSTTYPVNVTPTTTVENRGQLSSTYLGYGNVPTADAWKTARNFAITDNDASHTGPIVSVNGSTSVTLQLPSIIKASVIGHASEDLPLTGGTLTGALIGTIFTAKTPFTLSSGKVTGLISGTTGLYSNGIAISNPTTANDVGWMRMIGSDENTSILEIATGDDGSQANGAPTREEIYVRQYTAGNDVAREIRLFDKSGNSSFPGVVTAAKFIGPLQGTADRATSDIRGNAIINTYLTNVYAKSDDSSYLYKQVGPSSERSVELIGRYTPLDSDGLINIKYIPAAALERVIVVANQKAQYALTTANVQLGDVVKRNDTGQLYFVVDTNNLGNANGYLQFTAGTAANVNWSGILNRPNIVGSATGNAIVPNAANTEFTVYQVNGNGTSTSYVIKPNFLPKTGGTITGELYIDGGTTLSSLLVNGDARFVNIIQGSISGNAGTADKWHTARNVYIADADASHTGAAVSLDGSKDVTLKLPSIITATLKGTADNADTVDNKHANEFIYYGGDDVNLGPSSPAATAKAYFLDNAKTPVGMIKGYYNHNSTEYSQLYSRSTGGNYGSILRWGYADKYMYILRYQNGWKSNDWEKMDAGNADTWTTARNFQISDNDASHTGTAVSVNGSKSIILPLPATIKAYLNGTAKYAESPGINVSVGLLRDTAKVLASDYTDRYDTQEFLKAFVKWGQTNYSGRTIFGVMSPNSQGFYFCDFYGSGMNSTTGLPEHCTGRFYQHSGNCIIFGTVYGVWYYRNAVDSNNFSNYTASQANKWTTARSFITNLGSESAASVDGSTGPYNLGVTGTLPVSHGGTGKSSWTANQLVYSNTANSLANTGSIYTDGSHLGIGVNYSTKFDLLTNNEIKTKKFIQANSAGINVLQFADTTTPKEILIKTKIRYVNSATMPKITLHMYAFGMDMPADISIAYYIYNGNITSYGATSSSQVRPYITLSKWVDIDSKEYVAIGLGLIGTQNYGIYYSRFYIDCFEAMSNNDDYLKGWTAIANNTDTTIIPTENRVHVEYKDQSATSLKWATARNFRVTDNGATNSGAWVAIDGSAANYTLQLPATIKATLNGNADTATLATNANGLKNQGTLDSQEKIDGFLVANSLQYATFKTTEQNNIGMGSNDGMIISIPWTSTSYGAQIAFDDNPSGIIKFRGKATNWGPWLTLLHSENYNDYAVKKASASTDNAIVRWDGTDGRRIQNSLLSINDEGLLTLQTGNHIGAKLGSAYITSANSSNGEILLQNGHLRFGSDSWDYNQWAGLKYVHSSKIIYLGLADGTIFNANNAQSGGTLALPGIRYFSINGKVAIDANGEWLYINGGNTFSTGVYLGSKIVKTNGQFQVGDNGSKFYANSSGNGYFSNTLGIGGTNTSYKLYVNGTSYINGNTTVNGWLKVQNTTDSKNSQDSNASLSVQGGVSVAKQLSAKTIRIDGSSSDTTGSTTQGCTVHFNKTNNCIEFVFD